MEPTTLYFSVRGRFGNEDYLPECENSRLIVGLFKQKDSLNREEIEIFKKVFGAEFKIKEKVL